MNRHAAKFAALLAAAYFVLGGETRGALASAVGVCALAVSGLALAEVDPRRRSVLRAAGGTLFAGLFLVDPPSWFAGGVALLAALVFVVLVPDWRGIPTSWRRATFDAATLLGFALFLPALIVIAALLSGSAHAAIDGLRVALPAVPERSIPTVMLRTLLVVLLADGAREARRPAIALGWGILSATILAGISRAACVASLATLPMETAWSENPFLTNALKLDAHVPLYGDPELLNSYTYSPLIDLLHRACLLPFGLQLSLLAHRGLALAEQALAAAIMIWSLAPHLPKRTDLAARIALSVALVALVLSSLVAAAIHPDHPALVCLAVAWALLLREEAWARWAWWTALVLVTPLAVGFKLSGAGIGLGLAGAFALERRWSAVRVLAVSGALSAATIPVFNATLGPFSFYAITVQTSHPIEWHRLPDLAQSPFGLAAAVLAIIALAVGATRADPVAPAKRLAAMTLGTLLLALPAYLKYAGRDNNLIAPLLCFVAAVLLVATPSRPRRIHPWMLPAALLVGLAELRPFGLPLRGEARAQLAREANELADIVGRGGASTLLLEHASALIAGGRRGVPVDRGNSAVELYYAKNLAACRLFEHIASGRYARVVVGQDFLATRDDLLGAFNAELARSLAVYGTRTAAASYVLFEAPTKQQVLFRDCRP